MHSTIFTAKFHEDAISGIIDKLKQVDRLSLGENHVVLVPDRYTLSVERLICRSLQARGAFNISVLTLSRLALKLKSPLKYISGFGAVMLLRKAAEYERKNLRCFAGSLSYMGFCESLYKAITGFKADLVTPQMLETAALSATGELKLRLLDTALIYRRYEQLTAGKYIDSNGIAKLIAESAESSEYVKRSHFYIAGFDDLSGAELLCFKKLTQNALSTDFAIGCDYGGSCHGKIAGMLRQIGAPYKSQDAGGAQDSFNAHIWENINRYPAAAYRGERTKRLSVTAHASLVEETGHAAACILRDIRERGLRLSDILVLCTDVESYVYPMEKTFAEYNIPFYISHGAPLHLKPLFKALISLINCKCDGLPAKDVFAFVKSGYFDCAKDDTELFENYCLKYGINRGRFLHPFNAEDDARAAAEAVRLKLQSFILPIERSAAAEEYSQLFADITDRLCAENRCLAMSNTLQENGYKDEASMALQSQDKLKACLTQIAELCAGEVMPLKQYREYLITGAAALKLSALPVSADVLMCGDIDSARYTDAKSVYILGATEGNFPDVSQSADIFSIRELEKIDTLQLAADTDYLKLKRAHLKIRNLLALPCKSMALSCLTSDEKGQQRRPSENVTRLCAMYGIAMQTPKSAKRAAECVYTDEILPLKGADSLFFRTNSTSISSIETYFKCPRKHYYQYGLFLRPREEAQLLSAEIGNFLHSCVELFVKNYAGGIDCRALAVRCFDMVVKEEKYLRYLNSESGRAAFKKLKQEVIRTCAAICAQIENSDFKPYKLEAVFDSKNADFPAMRLQSDGLNLKIRGKIDRIDTYTDGGVTYVRVIDYKSGSVKYHDKDLYFGSKVQLFVYMSVLTEQNMFPAGLYYFPIHDNFEEGDGSYRLVGVSLNRESVLFAGDNSIDGENLSPNSLALKLERDKGGALKENANLKSREKIEAYMDYCKQVCQRAAAEIMDGNAACSPAEGCSYCDYTEVCSFKRLTLKARKLSVKKPEEKILEAVCRT